MALEYDMMLSSLKELQHEYLNKFRSAIGCEKASIFFVNEYTHELVLFTDTGEYFRIPPGNNTITSCLLAFCHSMVIALGIAFCTTSASIVCYMSINKHSSTTSEPVVCASYHPYMAEGRKKRKSLLCLINM